ncbi:MAG: phosphate signaling complex protein PhoU [Ruthenibacterium sp.]
MNARLSFDAELEALSSALITMGALATDAIAKAMDALQTGDGDLARSVMTGDAQIDAMERTIEHQCLTLLLRQQPVAGDLRKISTAIKMITDIERVGDAAADIAEISTYAGIAGIPAALSDIADMAKAAQEMVNDAIDAYVSENLTLAAAVIERDDVVDDYFNKIKMDLAGYIAADAGKIDCAIDYLMITKYLERLGDHAVNICEWVQFYKTGMHKSEKIL